MGIDPAGILAGIAVGGAVGTAMAGAWRNRALSLWKEQAEALGAQNRLLKEKVDELTLVVAGMEGELKHLRALPDVAALTQIILEGREDARSRQVEIVEVLRAMERRLTANG